MHLMSEYALKDHLWQDRETDQMGYQESNPVHMQGKCRQACIISPASLYRFVPAYLYLYLYHACLSFILYFRK